MIPVKLTIRGLYSYRSEQVIEFDRLLEGQIFGIFGGVGSGKSSILEAISFVLYDQTERLNQKDRRNYNMMNLKSDEFLIDFIFKSGKNDEYRFKLSTTRKKNKEEVNPFVKETYMKKEGEWIAGNYNASEILGLSYENFKRTIIIPQGKFQEFLQLTDAERVKMMKEIFQLEKFDLSDKVNSLISSNKLKSENLNGQLAGLNDVSSEILNEKENLKSALELEKSKLDDKLKTSEENEKNQFRLKQVYDQLQQNTVRLSELTERSSEFENRDTKLSVYENIYRVFNADVGNLEKASLQKLNLEKEIAALEIKIAAIENKVTASSQEFTIVAESYKKRDLLRQEYEELEILATIAEKKIAEGELVNKIAAVEHELLQARAEIQKWEEKDEAGRKKLEETRSGARDLNELHQIKKWFDDKANFASNLDELKEKGANLREKLLKIQSDLDKCIEVYLQQIPEFEYSGQKDEQLLLSVRNCIKGFENNLAELRKQYERLIANRKLEEFLSHLHDGKPCPLCGSASHPEIMNLESVSEELAVSEQNRIRFEEKVELLKAFEQQITVFTSNLHANEPILAEHRQKAEQINLQIESHKQNFRWEKFTGCEDKFISDLIEGEIARAELEKKIIAGLETVRSKYQESRKIKDEKETELNGIKQAYSAVVAEITVLKGSVKLLSDSDQNEFAKSNYRQKIEQLKTKYAEIERLYNEKEAELKELNQAKDKESGKIHSFRQMHAESEKDVREITQVLEEKLRQTSFNDLSEIKQILSLNIDVEKEKSEIRDYREKLISLRHIVTAAEAELRESGFSMEKYNILQKEFSELRSACEENLRKLVETGRDIDSLKERLNKKEELLLQLNQLNVRGENLRTISNLFRGHGFVNYISARYMINLCNAANDRFCKLTRQQLRLEVSENNDFVVRDYLNNGRIRSVKTLSGGQTFQASLCLALALADNIRQLNKAEENFFFLDEGFGTLDKDSLRMVFDTLKSLRKENRVVGIISHVEELQQEIDVYLNITNDPEEGSLIKQSWK